MYSKRTILIVDDDPSVLESLSVILRETYKLLFAKNGEECLRIFKTKAIDLVILDLRLPDRSGLALLEEMKSTSSDIPIIMLTAVQDTRIAVEAMKLGAIDYFLKPFNVEELTLLVDRALTEKELKEKVLKLEEEVIRIYQFENIIGQGRPMQEVFRTITQVMNQKSSVLILGESGTGKELVARAIHYNGFLKHGPFIPIDCSAIPKDLMESELFGHERGAFTGAHQLRKGAFELAHEGTLFLDEVGELPLELQSKLLRVIQEKEFRRVGGSEQIKVDVRIVAATNRNLKEMVSQEKFRKDLYYRIHVVPIVLPPLRERHEDIPILTQYFFHLLSDKVQTKVKSLSSDLLQAFMLYDWPGNVRELENSLERLLVTVESPEVTAQHFRSQLVQGDSFQDHKAAQLKGDFSLEIACNEFERNLILDALKQAKGVIGKAAERLNTTRRILKYKMDNLEILYENSSN